jgi:hypothetical protein
MRMLDNAVVAPAAAVVLTNCLRLRLLISLLSS